MPALPRAFRPTLLLLLALPAALIALPARAVEVQRVVSPGGITAWLVQDDSNPMLSLELAFRGGAAADPADKAGLSRFVAYLLDEGAGKLDSEAFQQALADKSIQLSFDAGRDTFRASMATLTRNRDEAFRLLRLALTEPHFDPEPVGRLRAQLKARLESKSEDPDSIAGRQLWAALFPDHPYGRSPDGTAETLDRIQAPDLKRYVEQRLSRDRLVIGVSGDIDAKALASLLDETFGALPASGETPAVPDVEPSTKGGLIVVKRDQPQSTVAFAEPGIARDDPDYYAAYAVNYVLGGGGFSSRLTKQVRVKRGLAYSVYSYLAPLDHAALIVGGLGTQNARVAESLDIVRQEWRRMGESGPTAEELDDAKTYLTGSFPLRLSSTGDIASTLVGMQLEHLGIDYIDRHDALIDAVTLEQAKTVAKRLFDAGELTTVVVGQPAKVEATRPSPLPQG
ncbi:zinc protease [Tistlia consotensis]|uniref:Zinc protease n=1 Tax=Tistlia consotensis USBA 355 TaxID=560819 RepID=A0A1Y6CRH7_9PROT|nr:pitrilysin family protein [Tistlia consotensis]SMF71916.1 zinc protease [Tistlia consotensis USBA 355]SNS05922.1 zinc protease [Tistlia consotensis]